MARLMKRGEVRWYEFKPPDKKRPVLVLTRDSAIAHLNEITIAPITSRIRDIPSEVLLGPDDGMKMDCAVNLDHVQTVPKPRIGGLVISLSDHKLTQVRKAIRFALDA